MKIPFDWKPNINEFQQVWDDLNKEPLHSGKLNFWRRVRLVCVYVQTLIKRMILNEKVNFSNEDSTVNNTLDFIGDVFDEHDTRIKKNAADIDALEGRMDIAEEDIRNLKQADENFDDRVTTWEQQVQTNKANITILETRIEANTTELNEQNSRLSKQEAELNSLQGDLEKTVIPDLNTAKNDIATLQNESAETKEAVEQMKAANAVVKFDITDKQSPSCDTELSQAIKVLNDGGKVAVANGTTNILSAEVNKIGESDIVVQVNSLEKTGDQWNITYNADGTKIEEASINPSVNAEDLQTVTGMIDDLQRYVNITIDYNHTNVGSCDLPYEEALKLIQNGSRILVNNLTEPIQVSASNDSISFMIESITNTGVVALTTWKKDGSFNTYFRTPSPYSNKQMIDNRTGFIDFTLDMEAGTGTSETSFADAVAAVKEGKELRCNSFTNILTRTAEDDSAIYARIESANDVGKAYAITWNADGITCSELPLNETININMDFYHNSATCDVPLSEAKEKLNSGAKISVNNLYNGFNVTIKDDIIFYISNVAFTNDIWKVTYNETGITVEIEKGKPRHMYQINEKDFKEFLSKIKISPAPAITNTAYNFSTLNEAVNYLDNFLNQFAYLQDGDYINVNTNTSSFVNSHLSNPAYMLLFKSYSNLSIPNSNSVHDGSLINSPYVFSYEKGLNILFSLQFINSTKDFVSAHYEESNNLFDIFYCLDELYFYIYKAPEGGYEIRAVCRDMIKTSTLSNITKKIAISIKNTIDNYHLDDNPTWNMYSQNTKGYQKFSDFGFVDYFYSMEPMSGTEHYYTLFDSTKYIKKAQFIRIFCVDMFTTKNGSNIVKEGNEYFYTLPNSVTMTKTLSNGYFIMIDISGSVTFAPSEIVDLNANGLVKKYKAISAVSGLSGDTIDFSGKHICLYYIPTIALSAFPVRQ